MGTREDLNSCQYLCGGQYPTMGPLAVWKRERLKRRRQIGRHIYATGSNEEAARLSGVNVDWTKMYAYTMSGALAGLAGNVLMSRLVTAQPSEGVMYELDAIAAAVIGGASLSGGVGTVAGSA